MCAVTVVGARVVKSMDNNVRKKRGTGIVLFKTMLFKKVLSGEKDKDSKITYINDTNSSTMQNQPRRRKEENLANGKICMKKRYSVIKGNAFKDSCFFLSYFPPSPSIPTFLPPFLSFPFPFLSRRKWHEMT